MTSEHSDPVDALLDAAFNNALTTNSELVARISRRIAREQTVRTLVLAAVGVVFSIAAVLVLMPAIGTLATTLSLPSLTALPAWLTPGTLGALAVGMLCAPLLYTLVDDPL